MEYYDFFNTNNTPIDTNAQITISVGDDTLFKKGSSEMAVVRFACNLESLPIFQFDDTYYVSINSNPIQLVYQSSGYPANGFTNPIYNIQQMLNIINTSLTGVSASLSFTPSTQLFTLSNPQGATISINQPLKSLFGTFPLQKTTTLDPVGYSFYQFPTGATIVQEYPSLLCWSEWINIFVETTIPIRSSNTNFNNIASSSTIPTLPQKAVLDTLFPIDWYPQGFRSIEYLPYNFRWIYFNNSAVDNTITFVFKVQDHSGKRYNVPLAPGKSVSMKLQVK